VWTAGNVSPNEVAMSETTRSEQACPVCLQHTLAVDEPPRIDVMGVQLYSDIVGMGDLRQEGAVGIICLNCGARWRDRAAFDRGEPELEPAAAEVFVGVDDLGVDESWSDEVEPEDAKPDHDEDGDDAR
jgi:hypothetical protein